MTSIIRKPDTLEKLEILAQDSQYDLSCACGNKDESTHRKRGQDDRWIYPAALPNGRQIPILKTLLSNICVSDCAYCPLRHNQDPQRCALQPEEVVRMFMDYWRRKEVWGLFLSSGIIGNADRTMELLLQTVRLLRLREGFQGYIHLKIIPGASDAAIEEAVALASAVSLNIETAGEKHFQQLSHHKNYLDDIIRPLKTISRLTDKHGPHARVQHTTQFIVGAAGESDAEIIRYMGGLYDRLHLNRVYFSAYQRGLGEKHLQGEQLKQSNKEMLMREHRLYQSDFLIRQYKFSSEDIPVDSCGQLDLSKDPKELWALRNANEFPVNLNSATYERLIRVPGLGPTQARRIVKYRRQTRIKKLEEVIRGPWYQSKIRPWVSC
jgi:predicted DNA-binding helix-hairpin-helix protein